MRARNGSTHTGQYKKGEGVAGSRQANADLERAGKVDHKRFERGGVDRDHKRRNQGAHKGGNLLWLAFLSKRIRQSREEKERGKVGGDEEKEGRHKANESKQSTPP